MIEGVVLEVMVIEGLVLVVLHKGVVLAVLLVVELVKIGTKKKSHKTNCFNLYFR